MFFHSLSHLWWSQLMRHCAKKACLTWPKQKRTSAIQIITADGNSRPGLKLRWSRIFRSIAILGRDVFSSENIDFCDEEILCFDPNFRWNEVLMFRRKKNYRSFLCLWKCSFLVLSKCKIECHLPHPTGVSLKRRYLSGWTASFAASDFSFLLNRKEKFPVLNVIQAFEGKSGNI